MGRLCNQISSAAEDTNGNGSYDVITITPTTMFGWTEHEAVGKVSESRFLQFEKRRKVSCGGTGSGLLSMEKKVENANAFGQSNRIQPLPAGILVYR